MPTVGVPIEVYRFRSESGGIQFVMQQWDVWPGATDVEKVAIVPLNVVGAGKITSFRHVYMLRRPIRVAVVAHGRQEDPDGTEAYPAGTPVKYVKPSAAEGCSVVVINGNHVRVNNRSI